MMTDFLRDVRERPVWQPMPQAVRAQLHEDLPRRPTDIAVVLDQFDAWIRPFGNGNTHPLFMGSVSGRGTPAGMVADLLSAGLNSNCGGRDHAGLEVERQVTRWMAEAFGFPADSSGLFVTGTSMANFLGLLVARTKVLGETVRARQGLSARLVAYTSQEAHGCIAQAMEMAGLGSQNLRLIAVDALGRLNDVDTLASTLDCDRAEGRTPSTDLGTAGSVNTGAIDDLAALADLAAAQDVWLHIDGAFGATAAFSAELRPRLVGLDQRIS